MAAVRSGGIDMKIKSILEFCSCKGCRKKYDFDIELKAGGKRKKFKLCEEHTKELMRIGKLKSVTFEETINVE
jgi:hypothetical protein